jgi:hypothetical protein
VISCQNALAALLAALVAGAGACGGGTAKAARTAKPAAEVSGEPTVLAVARELGRVTLDLPGVQGLSALARDQHGNLWAIAERVRVAVRLAPDGTTSLVPIAGVPAELDIEGAIWLADGRIALATESNQARQTDSLFFARLVDGTIQAEEERRLEYRLWGMEPAANQGIEGLCRVGGTLVMAGESVLVRGDERLAPVALHDLASGIFTPLLVRLTTRTGKISALDCLERAGGIIDVLAIERHFEVARLIRFAIPPGADGGAEPLEPVVVAELAPLLTRGENYEGLVWDGGARFQMVVDNDWMQVTGPNEIVMGQLEGTIPAPAALR